MTEALVDEQCTGTKISVHDFINHQGLEAQQY